MTDATLEYEIVTKANTLAEDLLGGKDFSLPTTGLSFPDVLNNPLYDAVPALTTSDLTTMAVDGTGVFDVLMRSVSEQLSNEYRQGRITGNDYAKIYVESLNSVLAQATQFLLTKDQSRYQAMLVQRQARMAEVAAIQARADAERAIATASLAKAQAALAEVEYTQGKVRLLGEYISYALNQKAYDKADYEVSYLLPAQLGQMQKETAVADYNLTYVLPKQVEQMQKAIDVQSAQISMTTAQKDQVLYQTASILPAQMLNIDKDTAVKNYTLVSVLPAQVSNTAADTANKTYINSYMLPAQVNDVKEGVEMKRAQTMDTRTDGITSVVGVLGKQKALYNQQIESYKRSDEAKITKMVLDTWVTRKSLDDAVTVPSSLGDSKIDELMAGSRTNAGL